MYMNSGTTMPATSDRAEPQSHWHRLLQAATRLQAEIPDSTLVGGSAAALWAAHRYSFDADHVLPDLQDRFAEVLAHLEQLEGWTTSPGPGVPTRRHTIQTCMDTLISSSFDLDWPRDAEPEEPDQMRDLTLESMPYGIETRQEHWWQRSQGRLELALGCAYQGLPRWPKLSCDALGLVDVPAQFVVLMHAARYLRVEHVETAVKEARWLRARPAPSDVDCVLRRCFGPGAAGPRPCLCGDRPRVVGGGGRRVGGGPSRAASLAYVGGPARPYYSIACPRVRPPGPPHGCTVPACILHELSHWTGHGTRLDRKAGMQGAFGSDAYAQEELRAEMAAMMLGIRLGVGHNPKHSASYIDGGSTRFQNRPEEIMRASQAAWEIVDMLWKLSGLPADQLESAVGPAATPVAVTA